jgi:hypothetical protein
MGRPRVFSIGWTPTGCHRRVDRDAEGLVVNWGLQMTSREFAARARSRHVILNRFSGVVAGLFPAIHALVAESPARKTWMPATSAGMTAEKWFDLIETRAIAGHVFTFLPRRPLGDRARLVRHKADQTSRLYRDVSRPPPFGRGSRTARAARRKIYVRTQQPMHYRWLATMECGALHEPFLLAEREACDTQGTDRVRGIALHRARGRNNLQLRQRIFRLLYQERRLPLRRLPHQSSRSPGEKNASTWTKVATPIVGPG